MDEVRLDGNAAAGTIEEIFSFEETMAEYTCGGCVRAGTLGGGGVGIENAKARERSR